MVRTSFFLLFLGLLISGCDSCPCDEPEFLPSAATSANAPIKTKTSFFAADQPAHAEEYTYNGNGQLVKIEEFLYSPAKALSGFRLLTYDEAGRLVKQAHHYRTAAGGPAALWPLAQQTTFSYQDERLHRQETTYPQAGTGETITYDYDGDRLTRMTRTSLRGEAHGYTTYAYDQQGNRIRESLYMASGEEYRAYTFAYRNGRKAQTEEFASQVESPLSRTAYAYDRHGNLVREEATVLNPLLCVMPTPIVRYEY